MTERTAAQKLQVKPGQSVGLIGATDDDVARLGVLPKGAHRETSDPVSSAIVLIYVRSRAELLERFASELASLTEARAVWFCYPKGNRADLNRDTIMHESGAFGWRPNSNVAIDDTWSAVRIRPLRHDEAPVG